MENEQFDKLLKETIEHHEPLPSPDLDRIRSGTEKRTVLRPRGWRLIVLTAAAASVFGIGTVFGLWLGGRGVTDQVRSPIDVQRKGSAFISSLSRVSGGPSVSDPETRSQVREVSLGVMQGTAAELLRLDSSDAVAAAAKDLVTRERRRLAAGKERSTL